MTLKFSRANSHVNGEPEANVSDIYSVAIVRVDVVNDRIEQIFLSVCQIDVSSCWCIM
jgi:hypothetical protein